MGVIDRICWIAVRLKVRMALGRRDHRRQGAWSGVRGKKMTCAHEKCHQFIAASTLPPVTPSAWAACSAEKPALVSSCVSWAWLSSIRSIQTSTSTAIQTQFQKKSSCRSRVQRWERCNQFHHNQPNCYKQQLQQQQHTSRRRRRREEEAEGGGGGGGGGEEELSLSFDPMQLSLSIISASSKTHPNPKIGCDEKIEL